jgi:hypothetical protein
MERPFRNYFMTPLHTKNLTGSSRGYMGGAIGTLVGRAGGKQAAWPTIHEGDRPPGNPARLQRDRP